FAGQQDARATAFGTLLVRFCAIAIEAILGRLPAMEGRAGFSAHPAVRAGRELFRELGHAPARKALRIRHAADGEPFVAVGYDRGLISAAGELLRLQRSALPRGKRFDPAGKAFLVQKVDLDRVLPAIGLDQL